MKILLSGSTGVIGQELGKKLVHSGHKIVALTRDPKKAERSLTYPAEILSWDAETALTKKHFEEVEAVIHLAGEGIATGRWTAKRKKEILNSRVNGTRNMVCGVRDFGAHVKTFISASGISYYGFSDEVLVESSPHGKGFLAEVCEQWEKELSNLPPQIRNITFRIAPVLTKSGGFLGQVVPLFRKRLGGRLGSGEQWMSWIHIEDLLLMINTALTDSNMSGVYNASANIIRNKDFTAQLCEVLHVPQSLPAPGFMLKILYGEMSDLLLQSQGVLSERWSSFKFRDFKEAAASVLGKP